MDVDQDIMDVIKTARLKKGYTQEYVAKRVYLSAKAYSKIETGKNRLRVDNLKAICDVLDIPYYLILSKYCPLFRSVGEDIDVCVDSIGMTNDEWAFVQFLADYTDSDISDIFDTANLIFFLV